MYPIELDFAVYYDNIKLYNETLLCLGYLPYAY